MRSERETLRKSSWLSGVDWHDGTQVVSTPFRRLEGLPGMVALNGRFEPTNVSKFTVQNVIMPCPELCQVTLSRKSSRMHTTMARAD